MPNGQHTETYSQTSHKFGDALVEAKNIEKQALALKIIAENLLSKAEDENALDKVKKKIKGA